jgi:hypothetical protein
LDGLRLHPDSGKPAQSPSSPPTAKPVLLNVGITGHRATVLTAPLVRTLRPAVFTIFSQLREAALNLRQPEIESSAEPRLHLHTALASGADQIAAICAQSSGYFVRAILPFEAHEYRNDFAVGDELDLFEEAVAEADEVVVLPGDRSDANAAYVAVGKMLVRTADIMIAIWDGELGKGPGGTAHVVELALESSIPVIHVDINSGSDEVRVRALTGTGSPQPYRKTLRDPLFYSRALGEARVKSPGLSLLAQ